MNHRVFSGILNQIHNQQIREFTIQCLKDSPDFLNIIPASTSGKYHPHEATLKGGLVWHIQRACWFGNMFFTSYQWDANNIKADVVLSALLLHDIGKKSSYGKSYWEYKNHPLIAGKMISINAKMIPEKVFKLIRKCVEHHMGPWTPKSILKDIQDYNLCELIVYQSDYLSSLRNIKVLSESEIQKK